MSIITQWLHRMTLRRDAEIERLIDAAEKDALAKLPLIYAIVITAHEKDCATFSFSCRRHGGFVNIRTTRGGADRLCAIDMQGEAMTLVAGHAPDMNGVARYGEMGRESPPKIYTYFNPDDDESLHGNDYLIVSKRTTPFMRPAQDDTITFSSAKQSICAPFGCGQRVYDAILTAVCP